MPSARSASQTFETSPGTAAKAGASSSHELANCSSESPSRLKFTIRICTATSSVRAVGPQDDDDGSPGCADEDLMRMRLVPGTLTLLDAAIAGDDALADAIGYPVTPGWVTFVEALPAVRDGFVDDPEPQRWSTRFFVAGEPG